MEGSEGSSHDRVTESSVDVAVRLAGGGGGGGGGAMEEGAGRDTGGMAAVAVAVAVTSADLPSAPKNAAPTGAQRGRHGRGGGRAPGD